MHASSINKQKGTYSDNVRISSTYTSKEIIAIKSHATFHLLHTFHAFIIPYIHTQTHTFRQ